MLNTIKKHQLKIITLNKFHIIHDTISIRYSHHHHNIHLDKGMYFHLKI